MKNDVAAVSSLKSTALAAATVFGAVGALFISLFYCLVERKLSFVFLRFEFKLLVSYIGELVVNQNVLLNLHAHGKSRGVNFPVKSILKSEYSSTLPIVKECEDATLCASVASKASICVPVVPLVLVEASNWSATFAYPGTC